MGKKTEFSWCFLELLVRGVLIDEIIFENIKKVNKNNHEGVQIWKTY